MVEINISAFDSREEILNAIYLLARANYRQTCVDLRDGVLQETWHQNNGYLRLCGVGLTGITMVDHKYNDYDLKLFRNEAILGAYSMSDELRTSRPKNVTTIKPSGSLSKILDCTEGIHKPLGKYIFNNIVFSKHDPLIPKLIDAGYELKVHPFDISSYLVKVPVAYENVQFDTIEKNNEILELNLESALAQLERYKKYMKNYVDHNVSITVSYDISEKQEIVDWLYENWNDYVGISFIFRNDPSKTAEDLGYAYLPQEVVTKKQYTEYTSKLKPVVFDENALEVDLEDDCVGGACPVR